MHILIISDTLLPAKAYGSTERTVWWLGKALTTLGHQVTYIVRKKSVCPFAKVIWYDETQSLAAQIPPDCDLIHLHFPTEEALPKPVIFTWHGNCPASCTFHPNTVFVSKNHARGHGGTQFVYYGIDFEEYGTPLLDNKRAYLHFLGKADWRVRNVKGAIELAGRSGHRLHVIGGTRVNFRTGLRITLSNHVRFHGMVQGEGKNVLLNGSKGLLYPTLWCEPFGIALLESWWFGCPVFGTPYGALPELMHDVDRPPHAEISGEIEALYADFGCLSNKKSEILEAIKDADSFDRQRCHDYVRAHFSAERMAKDYVSLYEKVLKGETLHPGPVQCTAPQQGKLLSWDE